MERSRVALPELTLNVQALTRCRIEQLQGERLVAVVAKWRR